MEEKNEQDIEAKRAEAAEELRAAFAELESDEGLTRFIGGHGVQSRIFEFEWSEPALEISFHIPYARVLSDEESQKEDDEEIKDGDTSADHGGAHRVGVAHRGLVRRPRHIVRGLRPRRRARGFGH